MHTLLALLLFVVVFVVPNQVIAEDAVKEDVEKRQVSVLARNGHLPYTGKRYADEEMSQSESRTSDNSWDNGQEPSVFLMTNKRYVGALAKTGDLARFNQKREDVDTLIDELLTAEELRKIRLEALRAELLRQEDAEMGYDLDTEKRSLASLARTGNLPYRDDKRSIASMAKSGYLKGFSSFAPSDFDKRGISSLARNGQLPYFGKRGGISSLVRNGLYHQKRSFDSNLDDGFFLDEYDADDKRNVAALARGHHLPFSGKRNIASFARNGWLQDLRQSAKKSGYDYWDDPMEESKRNIPSLLRNRGSPLVQGKRYLGSFVANNRLPYTKHDNEALERSWGKRELYDDDDINNDELANLYITSLLDQEPDSSANAELINRDMDNIDEDKRHIGSFLAQKSKSLVMRKKKSISPEDQIEEQLPTLTPKKQNSDENKMNNEIQQHHRQKRDAFADFSQPSDEYPMPVMQTTDLSEYEEGNSRSSAEQSSRKKRYFAVRGGGKIPGGRLPHVGRSRSNNPNSGRRRGGH